MKRLIMSLKNFDKIWLKCPFYPIESVCDFPDPLGPTNEIIQSKIVLGAECDKLLI